MRIVIEFYRTREKDDAHAVIGRETAEAADLDDAIDIRDGFRRPSACRNDDH